MKFSIGDRVVPRDTPRYRGTVVNVDAGAAYSYWVIWDVDPLEHSEHWAYKSAALRRLHPLIQLAEQAD